MTILHYEDNGRSSCQVTITITTTCWKKNTLSSRQKNSNMHKYQGIYMEKKANQDISSVMLKTSVFISQGFHVRSTGLYVDEFCVKAFVCSNVTQCAGCDKQLWSTMLAIKATMKGDDICRHFADLNADFMYHFAGWLLHCLRPCADVRWRLQSSAAAVGWTRESSLLCQKKPDGWPPPYPADTSEKQTIGSRNSRGIVASPRFS